MWTLIVGGLLLVSSGCVTTAECDAYVGCPDGSVCYQGQCLGECEDDDECDSAESCAPCYGDGDEEDGAGQCYEAQGGACVDESNDD